MMLTDYIYAAMNRAKYEILDDGIFYGEIPDCQGVWSSGKTLEECRENGGIKQPRFQDLS